MEFMAQDSTKYTFKPSVDSSTTSFSGVSPLTVGMQSSDTTACFFNDYYLYPHKYPYWNQPGYNYSIGTFSKGNDLNDLEESKKILKEIDPDLPKALDKVLSNFYKKVEKKSKEKERSDLKNLKKKCESLIKDIDKILK